MVAESTPPLETKLHRQRLSFDALGISPERLAIIRSLGFEQPTPIQAGLIPLALKGYDLIGQARTGTGKTAAFAIPILERLDSSKQSRHPRSLVLVPTRELAVQVQQEFSRLAGDEGAKCVAIYGGKSIRWQINRLKLGPQVIVGTPGRILDHLGRATLRTDQLTSVVLDEADRMLDIGFRPDIERILRRCPRQRQTMLLSATLPPPIQRLARRYMDRPKLINFSANSVAVESIDQYYFVVVDNRKVELLIKLIEREQPQQAIIFCSTKLGTQRLYRKLLKETKYEGVRAIHGDMTQAGRDEVMQSFRDGTTKILVATDVVGRGIDVSHVSHIINFDVPELSDDYVHRVGRTGRMGKEGVAFTLVTPQQVGSLKQIERRINRELKRDAFEGFELPEPDERTSGLRGSRRGTRYRRAL